MKDHHGNTIVSRIKTGALERRLHLASAGLLSGTRMATHVAANLLASQEKRQARRHKMLSREAARLVTEMGQLKGSVVKIGQMMALYGEHFLPAEITEALHAFEHQTTALKWSVIRKTLRQELGSERMAELKIERVPIGTASLGQVHRATRIRDGRQLCLKIQYPGVASAVDSDLDGVTALLRLTRLVKATTAFDDWLEEIRAMLHQEIDYRIEARTTQAFGQRLADHPLFIVPEVFFEYSTGRVLATSWQPGATVTEPSVQQLPQERRNRIARGLLELFFKEMFSWHEVQTDPNFGNYRVVVDEQGNHDQIVLLDFGAVTHYPARVMNPIRQVIGAAWHNDANGIIQGAMQLGFLSERMPNPVHQAFASVCQLMIEPVARSAPSTVCNSRGNYLWRDSDLPSRIVAKASRSAVNRYFEVPPKEFIFLNRKLLGVYTLMSVLDARINGCELIAPYLNE